LPNKDVVIKIIKSTIPILWLDTSVIVFLTRWKNNIGALEQIQKDRIGRLYDQIYKYTRAGKLICPLAEQDREIWVERDKWLDTIHNLSLGISTLPEKDITDIQFNTFMEGFVNNEGEITLSYKDAFHEDPVNEIYETLKSPVFVTVNPPILFGDGYQKKLKNNLLTELDKQREKNVQAGVSFEQQLAKEYMGGVEALFSCFQDFLSGNDDEHLNSMFGAINLNQKLAMWNKYTGNSHDINGLISFYKSHYYRLTPYANLSCNLLAKLMIDKQPIRSGDMMDIKHISTLMPYSNIFITDKAMSTFLKKRRFDDLYNTTVCYIGDTDVIDGFFSKLNK